MITNILLTIALILFILGTINARIRINAIAAGLAVCVIAALVTRLT